MQKLIVIFGPTASGKSELAVKLAKRIGGEIISADSRQVYRGLDIGTAKITKKEMGGIPHHLLSIISPKRVFSAGDFKKLAEKKIRDIFGRGKVPIICGGTGFYIQALIDNSLIPEIKPNWKLRKKLGKRTPEQLFKMLKKLDPRRAKSIDAKNPRRLIRAIEIAKHSPTKVRPSFLQRFNLCFLEISIKLPEKELKKRIEKRAEKMIRAGLIKEVEKLRRSGLSWKRINELGFEYKYPAMFLRGKINKKEMLKRIILENWHYAKRQMTWFKKYAYEK